MPMTVCRGRSAATVAGSGWPIDTNTSAVLRSSSASRTVAPACSYASSGNHAAAPAPRSTRMSMSSDCNRATASGASATRRSPAADSLIAATFNAIWCEPLLRCRAPDRRVRPAYLPGAARRCGHSAEAYAAQLIVPETDYARLRRAPRSWVVVLRAGQLRGALGQRNAHQIGRHHDPPPEMPAALVAEHPPLPP